MAVRLIDIARQLDLDLSTVSRALRDDPRVNGATRDRVRQTALETGYRPNQIARRLARGKTETIWCVVPGLNSPIDREPAQYAADALFDAGYDLMVVQHRGLVSTAQRIFHRLAEGLADGVLILPGPVSNPPLEEPLLRAGFPMVFIDRYPENLGAMPPVVTTDNGTAAAELCKQLVNAGAQPLFMGFDDNNSAEAERKKGPWAGLRPTIYHGFRNIPRPALVWGLWPLIRTGFYLFCRRSVFRARPDALIPGSGR